MILIATEMERRPGKVLLGFVYTDPKKQSALIVVDRKDLLNIAAFLMQVYYDEHKNPLELIG